MRLGQAARCSLLYRSFKFSSLSKFFRVMDAQGGGLGMGLEVAGWRGLLVGWTRSESVGHGSII